MTFSIFSEVSGSMFRTIEPIPVTDFERRLMDDPNYCRDSILTSLFHPHRRCYREVPVRQGNGVVPGKQFCFGPDGMEESHDLASPVTGKDRDCFCQLSPVHEIQHAILDVLKWT